MPDITPQFVTSYERRMRAITENSYARRLMSNRIWWNKIMKTVPIESASERVAWILDTATIEPSGPTGSGGMTFENMVTLSAEYPVFRHNKGIVINRDQLEDLNGTGLNQAAKWSSNIGSEIAYYPQRIATQLILNGANTDGSANAYDGIPFFADYSTSSVAGTLVHGHPYNPFRPQLDGYANWYHGAAVTTSAGVMYPGACPIDQSVSVDTALTNLGNVVAAIANVKMPNGVDPAMLTPVALIAAPRMAPRLRQLLSAKTIAQTAGSSGTAGGGADVEAIITGWGLGQPIIAHEFGGAFSYNFNQPFVQASSGNITYLPETVSGCDTTYYVICEESRTTELGGLLYLTRKPFKVNYYTGDAGGTGQLANLDRQNNFEYQVQGRMAGGYGHPYTVFRVDGS